MKPPPHQTQFSDSTELCQYVRARSGPKAILALSLGKDSIACWLKMREFFEVIPVHYEVLPGLRFVRETLDYYERFFGTRIHVYPHPASWQTLAEAMFQTPIRALWLNTHRFTRSYEPVHITDELRRKHGAAGAWVGVGNRAADSVTRAMSIKKHGPLNHKSLDFFPVFDWRTKDMVEAFRASGVRLSVDYSLFNRSFDSVRYRFLAPLKRHYPDDYARILRWYPLAEAELYRRKFATEEA